MTFLFSLFALVDIAWTVWPLGSALATANESRNRCVAFCTGRVAAVAIEITLGFPMSAHPCINTLDAVLFGNRPFSWKRKIPETLAMCGLALLVAILVPNVSDIFSLTGALASTPICFILPVIFLFKLSPNRGLKNLENAAALALFLIGLIIMVVSTVISVQNLIV